MPKYSIIVPVYNAARFLRECIDSVLLQSYLDWELLLIDDCSTDGSRAICAEYEKKDPRVRVFVQAQNQGVSAARNLGLEHIQGEYVLFLDSDDFLAKDYFTIIENSLTDDIQLLSFGNSIYLMRENGEIEIKDDLMNIETEKGDDSKKSWGAFVVHSFFASSCNKVFKAKIIREHKLCFDINCVCFEDYIFNINYCCFIDRFKAIKDSIYFYRNFEKVSHISKRKWGRLFEISRCVAYATDAFIQTKGGGKELNDIRRYVYQAYITELKANFARDPKNIDAIIVGLCKENQFDSAVQSIKNRGKMLTILSICLKLHLRRFVLKIIKTRILKDER